MYYKKRYNQNIEVYIFLFCSVYYTFVINGHPGKRTSLGFHRGSNITQCLPMINNHALRCLEALLPLIYFNM